MLVFDASKYVLTSDFNSLHKPNESQVFHSDASHALTLSLTATLPSRLPLRDHTLASKRVCRRGTRCGSSVWHPARDDYFNVTLLSFIQRYYSRNHQISFDTQDRKHHCIYCHSSDTTIPEIFKLAMLIRIENIIVFELMSPCSTRCRSHPSQCHPRLGSAACSSPHHIIHYDETPHSCCGSFAQHK